MAVVLAEIENDKIYLDQSGQLVIAEERTEPGTILDQL